MAVASAAGRKDWQVAIRVVVIDGHPIVRGALKRVLENDGQIEVVAEGSDGDAACALYDRHRPDVLVLDVQLPRIEGLDAIGRIRAHDEKARILVFSGLDSHSLVARLFEAGAMGYLSKTCPEEQTVAAVGALADGRPYLDPVRATGFAYRQWVDPAQDPVNDLSQREFQVFVHLAYGRSVGEIAETLFISMKTVGAHQSKVLKKLRLRNIAELVRFAVRHRIVEP
jgi:two-component system invasion response regulator UvrY